MKLFLSSVAVTRDLEPHFTALVGKKPDQVTFALIENAADVYAPEDRGFVERESNALEAIGLKLTRVDLRDYFGKPGLQEALAGFDVIWLGGGNSYYLRWALRESGFDKAILKLLDDGAVYAGGSAGAVVAGPTLKNFEAADEPDKAPELIEEGLNLVDFVPVPHWNNEKYGDIMADIKRKFDSSSIEAKTMTDEQAIIVTDPKTSLVP